MTGGGCDISSGKVATVFGSTTFIISTTPRRLSFSFVGIVRSLRRQARSRPAAETGFERNAVLQPRLCITSSEKSEALCPAKKWASSVTPRS
jgi:hypothetical protein